MLLMDVSAGDGGLFIMFRLDIWPFKVAEGCCWCCGDFSNIEWAEKLLGRIKGGLSLGVSVRILSSGVDRDDRADCGLESCDLCGWKSFCCDWDCCNWVLSRLGDVWVAGKDVLLEPIWPDPVSPADCGFNKLFKLLLAAVLNAFKFCNRCSLLIFDTTCCPTGIVKIVCVVIPGVGKIIEWVGLSRWKSDKLCVQTVRIESINLL